MQEFIQEVLTLSSAGAVKTTDQSESSGNRKEHIDEIPETHSAKTW